MQVIRHSFKQTHTDHTHSPLPTVSKMLYVAYACLLVIQRSDDEENIKVQFGPEATELILANLRMSFFVVHYILYK